MTQNKTKDILYVIALIGVSMMFGLLNLADALYEKKTLFKHLSITKKNILFCFAIISSPIWCPIIMYGTIIYYLFTIYPIMIYNICHCRNPNFNIPDIEAPVENIINDNHIDANTDTELIVL